MSMLLLDILDISETKSRSGRYLSHSMRYFASKSIHVSTLINKHIEGKLLEEVSQKETFLDTPFTWLTLANLKLFCESPGEIHDMSAFVRLLKGVLSDDGCPEDISQSQYMCNGFSYQVPFKIGSYLNLDVWDWTVIDSAERYTKWNKSLAASIGLFQSIEPAIIPAIGELASHILILESHGDSHGSMSPRSLIGNVFLPEIEDFSIVSECLIHECLHQYLYRIEHCGRIFVNDEGTKELYYSPWKDIPRPLTMVLHGAFVFTGVCLFYESLISNRILESRSSEFLSRLTTRHSQVVLALDVLRRNNHMTGFGSEILSILEETMADIAASRGIGNNILNDFVSDHRRQFATKDFKHVHVV
jgi:hypothetical protein